ncbi:MAG: aspartate/glutamate racemase family protein [Planctomycetota bacterium]
MRTLAGMPERFRHIGIAAVSPEGAALAYRLMYREAGRLYPGLELPRVTVHNEPLNVYIEAVRGEDWSTVATMLARSAEILASAGAELVVTPDNAVQHAVRLIEHGSSIPWLAVPDLVADAVIADGRETVGIIGTRWVTQGSAYQAAFGLKGVKLQSPEQADVDRLDEIIFSELIYGVSKPETRASLLDITARLRDRGSEALIVALSEAALVLDVEEAGMPVYDASAVLAERAVRAAAGSGDSGQPSPA